MTMSQRAASRRGLAAVACLALVAGLIGALASPAGATDGEAVYKGASSQVLKVSGDFGDGGGHYDAGLLKLAVDGSEELGYCIDFFDRASTTTPLPEEEWNEVDVANRDSVGRILGAYHPIGTGPEGYEIEGTDSQKAAATQAAIWHYTNGFDLDEGLGDDQLATGYAIVYANYLKILAAVDAGALPAIGGTVTLTIEGDTDVDAVPGQLVGPFVVKTSVASVELTPGGGGTIHNEDGSAFEGPASDGDVFWLKAAEAGTASASAVASGIETGVRAFAHPHKQDMAFVVATPVEVPASIEVTYSTPPTTASTSTTVPETTTTTTPPQTTTTVQQTTTTSTVPSSPGGGLPVTGAQTLMLVGVALALVAAGVAFAYMSKRSRGET
jgi:hypothetical protein